MQRNFSFRSGFSLRQLLPNGVISNGDNVRVRSCTSDARQVEAGDLFVAISGHERDGHDDVEEAILRGAAAFVTERLLPVPFPVCVVPDTREAYGRICHRLAGEPSSRMVTIGVTGTNGKTTTCHLLASVMQAARKEVALSSSLVRFDGLCHVAAERTTPGPAELADWMARSESHGYQGAIIEASSRGLAERRLSGVQLDCAVLTNIRRDHIDFHGTTLNYRRAKGRILNYLRPEGLVVVNADDPTVHSMLDRMEHSAITFGRRQPADITATVVERFQGEQTFLLNAGNETVPVCTRMIGDHHVSNCLAAAATASALGIPLTTIARGLEAISRITNRLDRVECGQEFGVFVDSADTPDRLAIALRAVRQVTPGRLICLFSGDTPGATGQRPLLGRVAERSADMGIITGCGALPEGDLAVVHDVLDGYDRPARARVIPTRQDAIRWALDEAQGGDSVLITGSGSRGRDWQRAVSNGSPDFEFARDYLSSSRSSPTCTATIGFATR
jgi:UDP-N-acetylmuramoyl-L-alanyl-D-glutamate--2,6-diaminopimelate ligase